MNYPKIHIRPFVLIAFLDHYVLPMNSWIFFFSWTSKLKQTINDGGIKATAKTMKYQKSKNMTSSYERGIMMKNRWWHKSLIAKKKNLYTTYPPPITF